MIKRSILLLFISLLMGQNLLDEHFNNSSDLPDGWEFIPENYPSNTGQWQISSWNTDFNNNAPSATYYWSPAQPNTFANPYDGHYMYSPIINVASLTTVIIRFQIALDGYPSPAGHYNGMNIEYSSDGGDWVTALNYEISAGGGTVDIMPRTESFYASMEGTLQLRWETYGTNAYYIDAWHVDDVKVDAIPSINYASIASNNADDNQKAIPGDIVSLAFTLPNNPDSGSPFVLINSTEVPITNPSGLDYVADYIVPEDATDGPISFFVDFTSDGVAGPTCRNTTDDTNVLVDVTGPVAPTVTDNVVSIGEDSYPGIWSSTDTQVQVDVLVPNDTTVIGFNYVDGNSMSFQGNSGQVIIPWNDAYLVSNEFTIEAYIKVNSAQNYEGFLDFGDYGNSQQRGFGFFLYSGGWRFYLKTTGTQKSDIEHVVASASVNTWVHFAARFQNGNLTLYRDGNPVDSRNDYVGPVDWSGFSDDLILGSFDKTATKFFDGKIDEVRLWNVARDENLIKAYKAVTLNGDEDGLIGYWRLDEGSPATTSVDLSTTNNSANLENGVEWVQDSPFFFQEEVLDPYSIIGSKFQILSKILENELIPIGERIVITEDHSIAGEISLTAPSDDFEGIQDFAHELEGQFSARLFDQAGNYEDGNISSTTLPIDIEANEPIFVSMISNNTFSHLAKTGDILTISITHDEDVNIPAVTINGNDGDESDLGGEQFQISYTLLGTEPEGEIGTLQSIFTDYLGNDGSYNGGSIGDGATVVNYDRTLPTLDQVTIISNNENTQWAKIGDQVTVNATASEVILSRSSTIQDQSSTISDISNVEFNSVYQFLDTDEEGIVVFNISFSDSAGNSGIEVTNTTNSSWVVFDKTPPEDFNTGTVISTGGNQVDNIWNSTNTGINISVLIVDNDTTIINGKVQAWGKIGLNVWEQIGDPFTINDGDAGTDKSLALLDSQVESITGFAEEDTIRFKTVITDRPGNEKEGTESINRLVIDETPPSIDYVSYRSNFTDTTLATVGHEITLTISTDEATQEPAVTIAGQNAIMSDMGNGKWLANYVMQDGDSDGVIPFEIEGILDVSGNPNDGTTVTTDGSTVIFDNTQPTLDPVRIASSNADTTWAKVGDTITVEFISNELLTDQSATIVTQTAAITSTGFPNFSSLSFDGAGDYLSIINPTGIPSGNDTYTISTWVNANSGGTRGIIGWGQWGSVNKCNAVRMNGNDGLYNYWWSNDLYVNGINLIGGWYNVVATFDGVTRKIYIDGVLKGSDTPTGHDAVISNFRIGSTNNGEYFDGLIDEVSIWTIALTETEIQTNMNDGLTGNETGLSGYWNFDEGTGSQVTDQTSNGNHGTINGAIWDTDIPPSEEKFYTKYVMTESDPEGEVSFEIVVIDSVGLVSDPVTETTNSSNVTFDRTLPTLDQVNIQSNNENNTSIAITGDDVILTFLPVEPLLIDSMIVTIANEDVTLSQDDDSYVATLTLSGDEPGGILPFSIDFQDRASNRGLQVVSTTDDSYVNHDIVPPEILTASIYSNNQDTTWSKLGDTVYVKFSANEALDNLNILIAGNSSDHIDDGGANYRGFHIMDDDDDEGDIIFSIEYTDLGGATGPSANSTTDETIVRYDRTLPQLTNIRMSSNNAMVDSAAIGDIDSLFFTVSEAHRNIVNIIAGSNVVPTQNELEFIAVRELFDEDPDGLISFSVIMEDSAGNSTGDVTETNDGSFVWFDGTRPTLTSVSFNSTNENDPSLAIVADTLVLDFESNESLSSISVSIAGTEADTIFINETRSTYCSWYILDGNEAEGFIPFQITFFDLVGNSGDAVSSTTDESSILFDITPPIAFAIDSVYVTGGNAILGYWNTSNDSIIIKTPISLDDESLIGGVFQPMIKFEDNEFILFGDEIEIGIIPDVGYELLRFSRNNFESVDGYAEDLNAQFTTKIIDKAGNETLGSSDGTIIHIDETIPTLDSVTISTNNILSDNWATTSDTISILFRSSEGLDIINSIVANDTIIVNGSMSGTLHIGKYVINIFDPDGQISFDISFADTAGNQGASTTETTDGTVVGIDNTSPSINALLEGYDNLDPTYYNNSDTITLYWNVEDTISGIRETYYALGSEPNVTDIVDWTMGGTEAFGGWSDLGLENNNTYHGAAFVRDSAGNYSDTIWGNGIYIDTELPTAGTINDGQWILEMDYTPDSTSLEYLWDGFSDNIGIDHFELSIGTNSDTINIQDWYQTDNIDNVMIDGLDLDRDTLYYTYIKAVDSAYNYSSAVRTDGIYFDDSEPKVMAITPDFSDSSKVLSVLSKDSIKIKFNRLIYFYDLKIRSSADSSLLIEESYSDSVITITWDDTLTSNDTLTVYLDSALAYNSLFVSETLYFFSHLWGDLNYDYDLTVEDILQFNRSWPEIDLGPFLGSPPHIRPTPDGQANLTDLSSFAKMWQWRYFNLSLDTVYNASRIQDDLSIIGRSSHIEFTMPKQTFMAEILVGNSNLNVEKMNVIKPTTNTFLFKSIDTLHSIVQFSLADYRGLDSILKMIVPTDQSHSLSVTIQYRFLDNIGNLLSSGINHLVLDLLPEKFLVYDNYPNPFNPITTIRYEIPDYRDIKIKVINIMGRTIKSVDLGGMMAGRHAYVWNGTNDFGKLVSTGIYFLQIDAGHDTRIKKMLLLK